MAFQALRIKWDGTGEIVDARSLTEMDRRNRFLCVGKCQYGPHKGEVCHAELTLFICTEKENHFSAVGGSDHKKGCEFCEKRKEKLIQILNRSCQNKTDADILAHLRGKATDGGGKPGPGSRTAGAKTPNDDEETADDEDLVVKRKHRLPKDADELYDVLTEFSLDDYFAKKPVSEWILDKRTFSHYYSAGLEDGQIALVFLGKMSPAKLPEELRLFNNSYYIFPCTGENWREKIYFLLPKDGFPETKMLFDSQIKQFAVLAAWGRASATVPAYICEKTLNKKQITFAPNAQADGT